MFIAINRIFAMDRFIRCILFGFNPCQRSNAFAWMKCNSEMFCSNESRSEREKSFFFNKNRVLILLKQFYLHAAATFASIHCRPTCLTPSAKAAPAIFLSCEIEIDSFKVVISSWMDASKLSKEQRHRMGNVEREKNRAKKGKGVQEVNACNIKMLEHLSFGMQQQCVEC